jgi:hypothetical protein
MKWFWLCNFQQDQMKSSQIIQLWGLYHKHAYKNKYQSAVENVKNKRSLE